MKMRENGKKKEKAREINSNKNLSYILCDVMGKLWKFGILYF